MQVAHKTNPISHFHINTENDCCAFSNPPLLHLYMRAHKCTHAPNKDKQKQTFWQRCMKLAHSAHVHLSRFGTELTGFKQM